MVDIFLYTLVSYEIACSRKESTSDRYKKKVCRDAIELCLALDAVLYGFMLGTVQ